ncbi:MAG: hypothetical protein ACJZ85_01515 [Pontiellaceae bacterium]
MKRGSLVLTILLLGLSLCSSASEWFQVNETIYGITNGSRYSSFLQNFEGSRIVTTYNDLEYGRRDVAIYDNSNNEWGQIGSSFGSSGENLYAVGFSSSGNHLAIRNDNEIQLYEFADDDWVEVGAPLSGLSGLNSAELSRNGDYLILTRDELYLSGRSGMYFVQVYYFNGVSWIQRGQNLTSTQFQGPSYGFVSVEISSDGSRLAVGEPTVLTSYNPYDGRIHIFNFESNSWVLSGSLAGVGSVHGPEMEILGFGSNFELSSDGNTLVTLSTGHELDVMYDGLRVGRLDVYSKSTEGWVVVDSIIGEAQWKDGYDDIYSYGNAYYYHFDRIKLNSFSMSDDASKILIKVEDSRNFEYNNGYYFSKYYSYDNGSLIHTGSFTNRSGYYSYNANLSGEGNRLLLSQGTYTDSQNETINGVGRVEVYEFGDTLGLTISKIGNGTVTPASGSYPLSSTLTLNAIPDAGWLFTGWSGGVVGEHTTQTTNITLLSEIAVTATFSDDADNDGIVNTNEVALGIDPRNSDTDGDSITDYDELYVHNSTPTNTDSDSDGVSDGDEIQTYLTSPITADSDGDGFGDGYEVDTGYDPASSNSTPDTVSEIETAIRFTFSAASGQTYRIEGTPVLSSDFEPVESPVQGDGGLIERFYRIGTGSNRFFRAIRD